jgi:zinc transport system permease protein
MNDTISFWNAAFLWKEPMAAALVAALLCGYLGLFVVLRRIAFVSAALSQVSGLGVAISFWVGSFFGIDPHQAAIPLWLHPLTFALFFAACGSVLLGVPGLSKRISSESVVALGYLAAGGIVILVLSSPRIAQEAHEIGDLLFGNAVAVRREHLTSLAITALVVGLLHVVLFKDFMFASFDPQSASAMGYPVKRLDLVLHLSIGVSVAVATRAIGALPVFAFLVLPAGAALLHVQKLAWVVALAVSIALVSAAFGFYLSFVWKLPTGPTMVAVAALAWGPALPRFFLRRR